MRSRDLTQLQLQIAMHIANGKTLPEIAVIIDCSASHVHKQANKARAKMDARTLPQLVSIMIARGYLDWTEHGRVVTSDRPRNTLTDAMAQ